MARPRRTPGPDSRSRLLEAGAAEFAARGYDGVSVDRIARRARLNKAMVYYYFGSKEGLYQEILRAMYRAVGARMREIADAPAPPAEKMQRFVAAFAREIAKRPQFPSIMMREMVERGAHLDPESIRLLLVIPLTFAEVLGEGVAAGSFRPVDPMLAYFSVLGPIAMLTASGPMRAAAAAKIGVELPTPNEAQLTAHLQHLVIAMLDAGPARAGSANPGAHS
jgi:AcrR family transcriptional regulator